MDEIIRFFLFFRWQKKQLKRIKLCALLPSFLGSQSGGPTKKVNPHGCLRPNSLNAEFLSTLHLERFANKLELSILRNGQVGETSASVY